MDVWVVTYFGTPQTLYSTEEAAKLRVSQENEDDKVATPCSYLKMIIDDPEDVFQPWASNG